MARLDGWAHGFRTEAARYGELLMVPPVAKKSEKKYDDDANFERMAPTRLKLWENAFQTIPDKSFFHAENVKKHRAFAKL